MRIRALTVCVGVAVWVMMASDRWEPSVETTALASTLLGVPPETDFCLMPPEGSAYRQTRGGGAGRVSADDVRRGPGDWLPEGVEGGDIMPDRGVFDPYPTFDAVALDAAAGRAFFTDATLSSVLSYTTTAGSQADEVTEPATRIIGPNTGIGFIAGGDIDPARKEFYAVNNDGGGVVVFSYDQKGSVKPVRQFETPHQSWGISISVPRDEVAITVQQLHGVVFYRRGVSDLEPPSRKTLRGYDTGLADPHGVDYDDQRKELVVTNHGNWTELRPYSPYDPLSRSTQTYQAGRFEPPSIRTFAAAAEGNTKPLRSIAGARTGLNWPMGVEVDEGRDEIVVANYGDNSVQYYRRTAEGDVAPVRVIKGNRTGIVGPVDVAIDTARNELWVANYSDHTALVFDRDASGDAPPKRIIRNAPKGTPALTFSNAAAAAYDTKRDALIVPN